MVEEISDLEYPHIRIVEMLTSMNWMEKLTIVRIHSAKTDNVELCFDLLLSVVVQSASVKPV